MTVYVNSDYPSDTGFAEKPASSLVRDSSDVHIVSFVISFALKSVVITTTNDKEEIDWNSIDIASANTMI